MSKKTNELKFEYRVWIKMKGRCYNPNNDSFHLYGGRGIIICERWLLSFDNFIEDMGKCPNDKNSIDRIDVNGNYEPSNCRWANDYEQCNNKRTNHFIEYNGERMTLSQWSKKLGINEKTLFNRVKRGWTIQRCLDPKLKNITNITYKGETKNITEWSNKLNINKDTIRIRIVRGWSIEKALTTIVK